MNLDELKSEWAARDQKLEQALALKGARLRASLLEAPPGKAGGIGLAGLAELAAWLVALGWIGAFLGNHAGEPRFFVPALLLEIWSVATMAITLAQRQRLRELDYGQPLLVLQKRLEALRMERMRTFKWGFLSGQLVWTGPFLVLLFKGVFGVDLYAAAPAFVPACVAFSLAMIPAALALAPRLARQSQGPGGLRKVADSLAGSDMRDAQDFLARLARFEQGA